MENLSRFTVEELRDLKKRIDKEIESRRKTEAKQAQQELKKVAEKYGFNLNELVGAANGKSKTTGKLSAKFRHPDDPSKTWSGRGRKPVWLKQWEDSGRSLEELKVA